MGFIPYRLRRNEPGQVRRKLEEQGELVVTLDGKPFAVMINLAESDDMEELLLLVSRLRAQMAARTIRSQAQRDGMDNLNDEQITELIQKTRAERKR
jgi:PHD/YefM family antitoxin component YafN of YafNO toxin-antitoxin module